MARPTILVVDDEEDIRELVELNLSREGYHVLTCETGEQALHRVSAKTTRCDRSRSDVAGDGWPGSMQAIES
jgi:DNA-binding response OmpR family regulator